jgi:hypothetical protein
MSGTSRQWIKSSRSVGNGACVELAVVDKAILLRNSRDPDTELCFTYAEITAFFAGVRNDEFDELINEGPRHLR